MGPPGRPGTLALLPHQHGCGMCEWCWRKWPQRSPFAVCLVWPVVCQRLTRLARTLQRAWRRRLVADCWLSIANQPTNRQPTNRQPTIVRQQLTTNYRQPKNHQPAIETQQPTISNRQATIKNKSARGQQSTTNNR